MSGVHARSLPPTSTLGPVQVIAPVIPARYGRRPSVSNSRPANVDPRPRKGASIYLSLSAACVTLPAATIAATDLPTRSSTNQFCPVMPEEKVDPRYTLEFEGRTIGFCCEKCVAKFQANPHRYRARLLDIVNQPAPSIQDSTLNGQQRDLAPVGTSTSWWRVFGRYHPVVVHMPVAGVPLALLGLCFWLVTKNPALSAADVPPLLVGGAFSIAAVVTGNIAEGTTAFSPNLQRYLDWHEYAGTTLMALSLALCAIRIWRWRSLTGGWLRLYACGLVIATVLAGLVGFLGGTLVFGVGHLWS